MASRTEEALQALVGVLAEAAGGALPEPTRNRVLADALDALDSNATAHLNIVDGDGEVEATELGQPRVYEISQTAAVEWIVKASTDADREAAFDAGLEAIATAIEADPTLGGVVDDTEITAVSRSNLAIEGVAQLKGAEISIRLQFTSHRPF
jgi:hypothetical protein